MMGSICAEPHHHSNNKLHPFLTKKTLRDLDIPPRKQQQLLRRGAGAAVDSPRIDADNSVFSKFLPYNDDGGDDDDDDPYSSDHFRMYEFKVRKCNRSRSHDWTDCPFAHPGEKARRRDPRRFRYSGTVCADFRKGHCGKGDSCEFSHGVFECWLHPSRYRTEACKDGKSCKRKICFFAHSSRQLRLVPDHPEPPRTVSSPASAAAAGKSQPQHCCVYCHCSAGAAASPTSTLIHGGGVSPPMSPPISPYAGGRYGGGGVEAYKDALAELMATFEAVNLGGEAPPAAAGGRHGVVPWLDVNFNVEESMSMSMSPPQFVMSPSTPSPAAGRVRGGFFNGDSYGRNLMEESRFVEGGLGGPGPDLGWVNDLLT